MDTRLDTPPFSGHRHPKSRIAPYTKQYGSIYQGRLTQPLGLIEADDGTWERDEGEAGVSAPLASDREAAEAVQLGQGAFDHPAVASLSVHSTRRRAMQKLKVFGEKSTVGKHGLKSKITDVDTIDRVKISR